MKDARRKRFVRNLGILTLALIFVVPAMATASLKIKLSSDKKSYLQGAIVTITASVTDGRGKPISSPNEAKVTIKNPKGQQVAGADLVEKGNGLFTYQYSLSGDAPTKTWKVTVNLKKERDKGSASLNFSVSKNPLTDPKAIDNDSDGFSENQGDCNDVSSVIYPGATETCGDGIDQDCSGADLTCTAPPATDGHYGSDCGGCHGTEANEVHGSLHYQWQGPAPYMVNQPGTLQGKLTNAVNSYCINVLGNWTACGACHVGKGAKPDAVATTTQLANIDCLKCHGAGGVSPTRTDCLKCHAKAGGGDAVKRGDLALATAATSDSNYDIHMATTGANLQCQSCHITRNHRIAGKGSDLRATDLDVKIECSNCHGVKPHDNNTINQHLARVACQTCHIPTYAKNASDTVATEATETFRSWRSTAATTPPLHPTSTKANNLMPQYRFWNGQSDNYLLGDVADLDPATGKYPTSRPVGSVRDGKLYPFKYKTAEQPMASGSNILIALDTSVFFATADAEAATRQGLRNMEMSENTPWEWVQTDTFQALNHQVSPEKQALQCTACHGTTSRMNLKGELGYQLKAAQSTICIKCHKLKTAKSFQSVHDIHVKNKRYDCSWCHGFSRPERGLKKP